MKHILLGELTNHWWILALRGVAALLLGLVAIVWPGPALTALAIAFGIYAIADGIAATATGLVSRWWSLVALGIVSVFAGLAALFWPLAAVFALVYVIGVWSVVRGISEIVAAVHLRKFIRNEGWLALAGVVSLLFGLFIMFRPHAGAFSVAWLIGFYAIAFGVLQMMLAFRLRRVGRELAHGQAPPLAA